MASAEQDAARIEAAQAQIMGRLTTPEHMLAILEIIETLRKLERQGINLIVSHEALQALAEGGAGLIASIRSEQEGS